MHETADVVGRDSHRLPMLGEERVQTPVTLAVQQRLGFQTALVPAAQHLALAQLRHLQIVRVNVHVANDLDLGNALQCLSRHLEQGTGEVARDALVALGAGQMLHQETCI